MRINVVPVQLLADIHLRAEYREILMSPHYYRVSKKSKKGIVRSMISDVYTLNKGHAMLWYNKMGFIKRRHDELEQEMVDRGFKTRDVYSLDMSGIDENDMNDYTPTQSDLKINIDRILERISIKKVGFYKMRGNNPTYDEWVKTYSDFMTKL